MKKKNSRQVSTHDLGIRMWKLAMANPKYGRALMGMFNELTGRTELVASEGLAEDLELAKNFWILGAIFTLNSLGDAEFGGGQDGSMRTAEIIETGEILVTGPSIFLKLPALKDDELV